MKGGRLTENALASLLTRQEEVKRYQFKWSCYVPDYVIVFNTMLFSMYLIAFLLICQSRKKKILKAYLFLHVYM